MTDSQSSTGKSPGQIKGVNPWVIAIVVSIATFMEVLDTTIANVALRYISGGLAVGPDQAAWVVTSYLVANSIILCASSWIAKVFGRRNFFIACLILFTISSVCCGIAWNLDALLFFRVLQGLAGGGMTPVAQSILASAFPPAKRGQAFAIYGIAVVVAPVVGPTLGGWLSDNYSWHWCFLINAPVGLACAALVYMIIPEPEDAKKERAEVWRRGLKFDYVGFILIASFLGALEVILDKGQEDDWLSSHFIQTFVWIAAISITLFIPWELLRSDPIVDLRMLAKRQFAACFVVMLLTGGILIATTQFIPQILQEYYGYTATIAGLALSPGGIVTMAMMFVIGQVSGKIQPKYLIAAGGAIVALSMYHLTDTYAGLNFGYWVWSRVYIGIGLPMIFIPITAASYDGIPPDKTDQASALINMARNFGGSIGVSVAQTTLARREQFHQSRLAEHVGTWNPAYGRTLNQLTQYYAARGPGTGAPGQQAVGGIGQLVQTQAAFLAYVDVFFVLCLMSAVMVPLALVMRSVKPGGAPQGAH